MKTLAPNDGKTNPVSVAIATYNGARYIEEQLDSILTQTLKPAGIVVCDDGSTDGTVNILEDYQQRGLLRYTVNTRRLGYVANFKKAVASTPADHYVALSDQDDVWLPGKIEAAMAEMSKLSVDKPAMVFSDLVLVDQDLQLLNLSFRNELGQDGYRYCLETLLYGGFVNGCTMLLNPLMREYFASVPDNASMNHDTWITLIAYTFGEVAEAKPSLIHYRKHTDNASHLGKFKKQGRFKRLAGEIIAALTTNDFMEKQVAFVQEFYNEFEGNLNEQQKEVILKFLRLKGKSYVSKKIALRRSFKDKWL